MYKARHFLNKTSLFSLYHSYFYSYLIYCIEVWGCAAPSHLHSLFLHQKKNVRIMTFAPYLAHTEPIFNSLEVWGCAAPSHLHSLFLHQKKNVRIMTFAPYLAHTEPIFNAEKIFINRVSIVMFKFLCNMLPDPIAKLYLKK